MNDDEITRPRSVFENQFLESKIINSLTAFYLMATLITSSNKSNSENTLSLRSKKEGCLSYFKAYTKNYNETVSTTL